MVTVSGRSGLTKAYVSVLSASGSWLMRGASRWLDALAVGTAGERSSAPRPSAAHAPMTDRDGALPCNFMCLSFRPPTLRTRAPERISAAPPGPLCPAPGPSISSRQRRPGEVLGEENGDHPRRRAGGDDRALRAGRAGDGARALRAPGDPLGAHHDGGAPSGRRRPTRLALHRAPGPRRGGTANLRRRRLPLLPPRRERGRSAPD